MEHYRSLQLHLVLHKGKPAYGVHGDCQSVVRPENKEKDFMTNIILYGYMYILMKQYFWALCGITVHSLTRSQGMLDNSLG